MKSLEDLSNIERVNRLGDFARLCRVLALNKGEIGNAADTAARYGASARVVEVLKSAVAAGGAGGVGAWGEQTSAERLVLGALSDTLKFSSAFARMVSDNAIVRLPLEPAVVGLVATSTANAAIVPPGAAVPVRRMDIYQKPIGRQKAGGIVVLTDEFMRQSPSEAESIITRALRSSVGQAIDAQFVTTIATGVVPRTSTGLVNDVRTLLEDVDLTPDSRPYWVAAPDVGIALATQRTNGVLHFPGANVLGGELVGIPLLVSVAVPAGTLMLVDAARIGGGLEEAEVSVSTQGTVEMDSSPTMHAGTGSPIAPVAPAGGVVSLWQMDCIGIKATQNFGVTVLRPGGAASIFTGGSP